MRLAELTRKWIGTPFDRENMTCIGFVHAFLEEATGKEIPRVFGDLSIDNYRHRWREDKAGVEATMLEAIKSCTTPHRPEFPRLLDMLVVHVRDHGLIPAVYVGNGNAVACFIKLGVAVFHLDENNRVVYAGAVQ